MAKRLQCGEVALLLSEKNSHAKAIMENDTHYLCIRLEMRSDAVLDEPMLRQTLLQTFESLGGLSRAIVHYDVLAINESSLPGVNQHQDWEAWICLHRR